jgi:hypothetical protein
MRRSAPGLRHESIAVKLLDEGGSAEDGAETVLLTARLQLRTMAVRSYLLSLPLLAAWCHQQVKLLFVLHLGKDE